ncbi:MAG: hypothetical protein JST89_21360 [Cyanobacteria bacterium SZAS-4]|nr:hypothetical protein [Cyanobacteria bacterium SZAS-4]
MGLRHKRALCFTDLVQTTHLKIVGDKFNLDVSELPAPFADDFWSMLQKYLLFDEPSSRCTRLKKSIAKQMKSPRAKEIDLSVANQDEQDRLFDAIFGARPNSDTSRLLSVLLGLEEIARFDEITFASWSIEAGPAETNSLRGTDFWKGLDQWFAAANLSAGQIRWLHHCAVASPNWSALKESGPWSGVSIAIFLLQALKQIENQISAETVFDTKTFATAHAHFNKLLKSMRPELPGHFMPNAIVIVEGSTEEVLLPRFGQVLGMNFQAEAIMIVSAGGAKQVAKRYLFLRDLVAIPIVCILDRDAEEQSALIADTIRDCDRLFVLQAGEIEDTFNSKSFARYLNSYLESFPGSVQPVVEGDVPAGASRKAVLARLWKARKLGDFDKIAFAESVAHSLDTASDVPVEFVQILKFLAEVAAENA